MKIPDSIRQFFLYGPIKLPTRYLRQCLEGATLIWLGLCCAIFGLTVDVVCAVILGLIGASKILRI